MNNSSSQRSKNILLYFNKNMKKIICPKCNTKTSLAKDKQCHITHWRCQKCGTCCVYEKKSSKQLKLF